MITDSELVFEEILSFLRNQASQSARNVETYVYLSDLVSVVNSAEKLDGKRCDRRWVFKI